MQQVSELGACNVHNVAYHTSNLKQFYIVMIQSVATVCKSLDVDAVLVSHCLDKSLCG